MKILVLASMLVAVSAVLAADAEYIGADKCKMCHKVEYTSWSETPHAGAYDKIKAEDRKPECLNCHATGKSADMPGVQCEACHGAGSEYKSMKIMKDQEAAIAAGLVLPDESTCKRCHEGDAPHDLPPFDFAKAKEKGLHEVKAK
jgi:hypothetical protein